MKTTKFLSLLLITALSLSSCGDDEDIIIQKKDTTSNIEHGNSVNVNKNSSGPIEAQTRYEFPKLKGGNNIVIVHKAVLNEKKTTYEEGVNYCVEWDPSIYAQRWSCYQLYDNVNYSSNSSNNVSRYKASNDGSLSSSCQYPNDPDLSASYRLTADPYKYNGFDHGHICPSADRLRATECNYQTFYITNMQPQYTNFNGSNENSAINQRSPWFRLESQLRTWANECDTLYVCKGGTIDKSLNEKYVLTYLTDKINGKNKIPVPGYFFVALFSKKGTTYNAIGFWMEHLGSYDSQKPLSQYACSIDKLEELTGIDFFCNLPDDIEEKVEKTYSSSSWKGNLQ